MLDNTSKQTAVGALQELSKLTSSQMDQFIHTFKSKFRAPMANRTWKFDLVIGTLAPMRVRELFTELINSFSDPDKTIVIAVKRSQQPDTEKKLWAAITKRNSAARVPALPFIVKKGRAHTSGVVYQVL